MVGRLEVNGFVTNEIDLEQLKLRSTNNNTINIQTSTYIRESVIEDVQTEIQQFVDLYELGTSTSNIYNPNTGTTDTSSTTTTTTHDFEINLSAEPNLSVAYNSSFYTLSGLDVSVNVELILTFTGEVQEIVIPLPYESKRSAVGQIVLYDPDNTSFMTNLGKATIDKLDMSNLKVQSNLFNNLYSSPTLQVLVKIEYERY